jgi:predicted acyltransferase
VKVAAHHFESLDVFRGITMAAMILVNNPGDWSAVFPPLMHEYWTGCTFADLIFPWFIFILGAAMPFAFARRRRCGQDTAGFYRRIIRRAALLLVLGLLLNWLDVWPVSAPLRYPGVLQRIAVSYLLAAVVVMNFDQRVRALAAALLLGGHWALLTLVPFGGHPGGTLNPEHNLAGYVDATILGRHALARPIDPEGLLGILPSAATAIIGVLAGDLVRRTLHRQALVRRLAIAGAATLLVGLVWSLMLPVSKPLWTGSYVLIVTGLGMLAFDGIYLVVDARQLRSWARPFVWLGVNPLAIYFLSEVTGHLLENIEINEGTVRTTPKALLVSRLFEPVVGRWGEEWASFAFAAAFVTVWVAVAGLLYQRRIRIQV